MDSVVRNLPQAIAIIVILLCFAGYFTVGGLESTDWLRNVINMSAPFALIVTSLITFRSYILKMMNRKTSEDVWGGIIFFATTFLLIGVGFTMGRASDLWYAIYDITDIHGYFGIMVVSAMTLQYLLITRLRPTSWGNAVVFFTEILVLLTVTPVGDLIWPEIAKLGILFYLYPSAVGGQIHWFIIYIAFLVLVVRILVNKERIRAGV
jgi:hypothetical protein